MSTGRLRWLVALGGAVWTWLLASWNGISLATSLFRAVTVFVMLTAVFIVLQVVLGNTQSAQKPVQNRPAAEETPAAEEVPDEEGSQERQAA